MLSEHEAEHGGEILDLIRLFLCVCVCVCVCV